MSNFVPGHLDKDSESKINDLEIKTGQMIYSEKSGLQFVDYKDKRHTYGPVLAGIYNEGSGYVDFTVSTLNDSLNAIKNNGLVIDGQIVKVGNLIYKYRKIGNNHFITKIEESSVDIEESKVGFMVYFPEFAEEDSIDIDMLVSVYNEANSNKIFLIKIVDNNIDLASCQDLDGAFDSSTFDLSVVHNGSGLFTVSATIASTLKVISFSVSSSGSNKNEGIYVAVSDL